MPLPDATTMSMPTEGAAGSTTAFSTATTLEKTCVPGIASPIITSAMSRLLLPRGKVHLRVLTQCSPPAAAVFQTWFGCHFSCPALAQISSSRFDWAHHDSVIIVLPRVARATLLLICIWSIALISKARCLLLPVRTVTASRLCGSLSCKPVWVSGK